MQTILQEILTDYAPDDGDVLVPAMQAIKVDKQQGASIDARARRYIQGIRDDASDLGGVEDFLRVYGLSTAEGLALMILAEALLRVPDPRTQDKLIEDKLQQGDWANQHIQGEGLFVTASAWALGVTSKIIKPGETPENVVEVLVKRMGMPTVRTATKQAMRFLGHHFVLGETISDAIERAKSNETKGYCHSYDMLGEGARTKADAQKYYAAYADAIEKIGRSAGNRRLPFRPGISVKLSALHPKYFATNRTQVLQELVPDLLTLAQKAKSYDLNFTIDAEEADRLELSLEVLAAVFADQSLADWDGFGLAIQAYQKRASTVIAFIESLCRQQGRKMMVRLVKGAYWDTEIKRAQERGLSGYPVFTRKPATDVNYIACAKQLLAMRDRLYPQFATHNALTVATILEHCQDNREGFEFQRLHGMGEELFKQVTEKENGITCRIYAPVGGYKDLLAYLVRRLLENGANSSFVSVVGDDDVPIERLLRRPGEILRTSGTLTHPKIRAPMDLYPDRQNSAGLEFGCHHQLSGLLAGIEAHAEGSAAAPTWGPKGSAETLTAAPRPVLSPIDGMPVGQCHDVKLDQIPKFIDRAAAGFDDWNRRSSHERAATLRKVADLLEVNRDRLMALLIREAGKTLDDGIAEIREAVDFCRYYANEAERLFGDPVRLPGPTGEENLWKMEGRGVFICISPWNFPLAIFLGQVTAALAAGNAVIAKPAEQTPLIAWQAFQFLHEAGVPADAALLAPGDGAIGAALTGHARIAGVAFTGSTQTARKINQSLAAREAAIVPLIAETGGLNAMIVDATALPEQVADDVIMSAFRSAGQRCSALRLLFLQDSVADAMLEMIIGATSLLKVGDPGLPETDIGPIIDAAQKQMLESHIETMSKRQNVIYRGQLPDDLPSKGVFFPPHIIELEKAEHLTEEVFGPVLHVVRWKAGEMGKVIDSINSSGYGLTFGMHSRIDSSVEPVTKQVRAGNLYINRNTIGAIVGSQPFGGSGLSGTGPKAGGPHYLARFGQEKVISTNTAAAGGNAALIAMDDA